jgi:hypothetical protein
MAAKKKSKQAVTKSSPRPRRVSGGAPLNASALNESAFNEAPPTQKHVGMEGVAATGAAGTFVPRPPPLPNLSQWDNQSDTIAAIQIANANSRLSPAVLSTIASIDAVPRATNIVGTP